MSTKESTPAGGGISSQGSMMMVHAVLGTQRADKLQKKVKNNLVMRREKRRMSL